MNQKNTQQLINEMKEILGKEKGLTVESFCFGEDIDMPSASEINNPGYDGGADFFDEGESVDKSAKKYIDQIRLCALDGMKAIIDQPGTPTFDLLKKMFDLSNKAVETKEEGETETAPAPAPQPQQPAVAAQ